MRAVTSSRQDQGACMGILVVPLAVCRVLDLCTQQYQVSLLAAWPSGIRSCTQALARVTTHLPPGSLDDPVVTSHIFSSADRDDLDLPLQYRIDLILVLVRSIIFICIRDPFRQGNNVVTFNVETLLLSACVPCAFQLRIANGAIGKWMQAGRRPEDKLMANTATEITGRWLQGLSLIDEGMQRGFLSEESKKEWQRLIPVMFLSFQIAKDMVQRVTFSDQASLDRVCSSGLALPLRFLLPHAAVTWRLNCTFQAVRLLFSQEGKQKQDTVAAAGAPPARLLVPSHDVRLSILQAAAPIFIGEN